MQRPWYKTVGLAMAWIMFLPALPLVLVIFTAIGVYCGIVNLISEFKFRRRMISCERFLSRRKLSEQIDRLGSGTLILDSPSLGWGLSHAWWTPDRTEKFAPTKCPTDDDYRDAVENQTCLEWDQWHWNNYTNPESGTACLVRVWNSKPIELWLKKRYPDTTVVHTWSGLVHLSQLNDGQQ
jgi:hypothetical protein